MHTLSFIIIKRVEYSPAFNVVVESTPFIIFVWLRIHKQVQITYLKSIFLQNHIVDSTPPCLVLCYVLVITSRDMFLNIVETLMIHTIWQSCLNKRAGCFMHHNTRFVLKKKQTYSILRNGYMELNCPCFLVEDCHN